MTRRPDPDEETQDRGDANGADVEPGEPDAPAGAAGSEKESEPERSTRRGAIAAEIYEQVERILQEGVNKSEAFARIAGETGRRAATVAANYYRAARRRGEGGRAGRSAPAATRQARGPGRRTGVGGDAAATLGRARAALQELADLARRQEQELVRLRGEQRQYEQIRTLIDGGRRSRGRGSG